MGLNTEVTPEGKELCLLQKNVTVKRTKTASLIRPKEEVTFQETTHQCETQAFQTNPMKKTGCMVGDWFNRKISDGHGNSSSPGIANTWQASWCNRTVRILDDFQQLMNKQRVSCGWTLAPKTVLSFGCSIGIECLEASARFPEATVYGYDIDAKVIEMARKGNDGRSPKIKFESKIADLPQYAFDLITVNNVLFQKMEPREFSVLLKQLNGLLNPLNGTLELMIYDKDMLERCPSDPTNPANNGLAFDPDVAWQGIADHVSASACSQATTSSWYSKLFVFRSSEGNPLITKT